MCGPRILTCVFDIVLVSIISLSALAVSILTVLPLSSDDSTHFEILRVLADAPYGGSDGSEGLTAAN